MMTGEAVHDGKNPAGRRGGRARRRRRRHQRGVRVSGHPVDRDLRDDPADTRRPPTRRSGACGRPTRRSRSRKASAFRTPASARSSPMKHVGLNVAADPFMNVAVAGAHGGLVLAVADDPSMHSSQNEQDSRYFADFAQVPCLEPSDQQECYDLHPRGLRPVRAAAGAGAAAPGHPACPQPRPRHLGAAAGAERSALRRRPEPLHADPVERAAGLRARCSTSSRRWLDYAERHPANALTLRGDGRPASW